MFSFPVQEPMCDTCHWWYGTNHTIPTQEKTMSFRDHESGKMSDNGSRLGQSTETDRFLSSPPKLKRVGASIGQNKSPTLRSLLIAHVPDFIVDEEDGIVAMFAETHRGMRATNVRVSSALRTTLAKLWQVWQTVSQTTKETTKRIAYATTEKSRAFVEDEDVGLKGVWNEVQDIIQLSPERNSRSTGIADSGSSPASTADGKEFLDALLANMLCTFVHTEGKTINVETCTESPLTRVPSVRKSPVPDTDASLQALFRQVSHQFPSLRSVNDVERHLLQRLAQISEESNINTIPSPFEHEYDEKEPDDDPFSDSDYSGRYFRSMEV
jgi:hypothetical protein